ncbi:MAG: hypothetical protein AAF696_20920 [Bacteroidota bacterium]
MRFKLLLSLSIFMVSFYSCQKTNSTQTEEKNPNVEAISLLGQQLYAPEPSAVLLEKFQQHKTAFETAPNDPDKLIWYARFMAYQARYKEAIDIYSKGIKKFPEDARIYRHRGHRYISVREFDAAISDFEKAANLIEGKENEVEPDGMPNAQNIPVSSLHGNIFYHLGLAYYIKHDFLKAREAYEKCLATSTRPDNVVSATHWLYMISRRMGEKEKAKTYLEGISSDMEIIENFNYHDLCLFYKGEITLDDLAKKAENPGSGADAILYGMGNWYYYEGEEEKAKEVFTKILAGKGWSSFGYIAAEKEIATNFRKE